jgi:hypothetical protein
MMKTTAILTFSTAAILTLGSVQTAFAKMTPGQAVTACKAEVTARFGKDAHTKLHRLRSGKVTKVSLSVRGVEDKTFKIECKINGQQQITLFTDSRDNNVASR